MQTLEIAQRRKPDCRINWNNKAERFGEKLYKSLDYLAFRAASINASVACDAIEKVIREREKYRLFQEFFPAEWRRSKASCFKTGFYEHYSERAGEFFKLINDSLFPLLAGWNEDPETDFENFHIFSFNHDLCCEDIEYEHVRPSYLLGLVFYIESDELWETLESRYGIRREDFPEIQNSPHENLWRSQDRREKTLRLYVDLFEIVDHSTGNPWLDATNCCQYGDFYTWSAETIVELARTYKEANELLNRLGTLDALVEMNPKKAMRDLITLWNSGELPALVKKNKRRTGKAR